MRRFLTLVPAVVALAAAIGCGHTAGKCDCQADPSHAVWSGPTNPYPTAPTYAPATKTPDKAGTVVPDKLPMK